MYLLAFLLSFLMPLQAFNHFPLSFDVSASKSVCSDSWEIVMSCNDLDEKHVLGNKFRRHIPIKQHEDDVIGVFTGAVCDVKASVLSDSSAIVLRNVALFDHPLNDSMLFAESNQEPKKIVSEAELSQFVRDHLVS